MRSPLKNLRGARNQKRNHPRHREMATSHINKVKAPLHTEIALAQIFRGLLDSASRSTELQGVVVVGDLRVDTRELVDLEFDFVAIPKRSGATPGR